MSVRGLFPSIGGPSHDRVNPSRQSRVRTIGSSTLDQRQESAPSSRLRSCLTTRTTRDCVTFSLIRKAGPNRRSNRHVCCGSRRRKVRPPTISAIVVESPRCGRSSSNSMTRSPSGMPATNGTLIRHEIRSCPASDSRQKSAYGSEILDVPRELSRMGNDEGREIATYQILGSAQMEIRFIQVMERAHLGGRPRCHGR